MVTTGVRIVTHCGTGSGLAGQVFLAFDGKNPAATVWVARGYLLVRLQAAPD